jgi:vacuolar-type H+-ATPase subunit H
MAEEVSGNGTTGSVEALKRVKAAETEWESRVSTARQEAEDSLQKLREESEAAIKAAQAEAERERTERLERARTEIASEAETILTTGQTAAAVALRGEGRRPTDKKGEILDTVLGSFKKD